ncbi:MAG: isochorismatase hydrolase [Planctomycetota bacterium]|nr:isochorismatase hydrolase [Planctomycetota bacterium]
MLDTPLIFVDIDTQRDFLEPSGALFVPGSGAIRANLARLTAFAKRRGIPVLATACAHTLDEIDPEPFPPHCLIGTPGQERIAETAWEGGTVLPPGRAFEEEGEIPPHLTVEKTRYDVFSRPDADSLVRRYGRGNPTFVVYGVATDYCVRAAVLGLLARGRKVAVVVDAVRAIDQAGEPEQFREFVAGGAMLTITEVVTTEGSPG